MYNYCISKYVSRSNIILNRPADEINFSWIFHGGRILQLRISVIEGSSHYLSKELWFCLKWSNPYIFESWWYLWYFNLR